MRYFSSIASLAAIASAVLGVACRGEPLDPNTNSTRDVKAPVTFDLAWADEVSDYVEGPDDYLAEGRAPLLAVHIMMASSAILN